MTRSALFLAAALCSLAPAFTAGCASDDSVVGDEEDVTSSVLAVKTIKTKATYEKLAFQDGGVILPGKSVKFLIDNRDKAHRGIFYMNANFKEHGETPDAARFHYYFAERILDNFDESLDTFNDETYSTQDKHYYAGTIQTYEYNGTSIYGIQLYPEDVAKEDTLLTAIKKVKETFTISGAKMAFVATGPQQTTKTIQSDLKALGVQDLTIDEVLSGITYLPMNQGEAWGFLRIFPSDPEALTPADIPVFNELPLDLAVVPATITKAFQDASCHVNLKSRERGTPDMVLRDAGPTNARLKGFADAPVHLVVGPNDFTIEASTEDVVRQKVKDKLNKPWSPVPYQPATALLSYAEMCSSNPADCLSLNQKYGTKSANLGFMTNKKVLGRASDAGTMSAKLGYDLVPLGFGVPLKLYKDFVAYGPNTAVRTKIKQLVDGEKQGTLSPKTRAALVAEVQQAFYDADLPPGMLDSLQAEVTKVLPGVTKFKVRSSANAEDLENFDGAGLYDSFGVNTKEVDNADGSCKVVQDPDVATKADMSPKTLQCAVKGVYASLWNKRAVEERSFAHFDHTTATMGLAIVPKYDLTSDYQSNSVVVTRALSSKDVFGYTFATQLEDNLVTNPTPGTLPEEIIAGFVDPKNPPSFIVTHYAIPTVGGKPLTHTVMTNDQMKLLLDITRTVETAYCKAKPSYYNGGDCGFVTIDNQKENALDFELKLLQNGHFVAKQVREFGG